MKKSKWLALAVLLVVIVAVIVSRLHGLDFSVLSAQGEVSRKERNLIILASLLSLIVVVPVFAMLFGFAWKYRESNTRATYRPNWDHNRLLETIWWIVPLVLITILAVVAWNSSHELDPYKPLVSNNKPINIQVVALDWKWLFIYPEQHIASVNFLQFPQDTPVNFTITSDAPMNSFWIPSLGGQVYAMSGMSTQLHLMAYHAGDYNGSSANISGTGFAGMKFTARASSQADFDTWVAKVKRTPTRLDQAAYAELALPSQNNATTYYTQPVSGLYDTILMKYMAPKNSTDNSSATTGSSMPGMSM